MTTHSNMIRINGIFLSMLLICATMWLDSGPAAGTPVREFRQSTPAREPGLDSLALNSISIGTRSLSLQCAGSGSPLVMLIGGYGGGILDWSNVHPELTRWTRVCSYDRAGIGLSEPGSRAPMAASETSRDLHALLVALDVEEPVVLVGFSVGGLFARYHAALYPEEVAGVVLIDPTPPEWPAMRLAGASGRARSLILESLSGLDSKEPELLDMLKVGNEVYSAPEIQAPVMMVTSGIKSTNPGLYGDELSRVLSKLQHSQARDLDVTNEIAELCTHYIPMECSEIAIEAIARMVEQLRTDSLGDWGALRSAVNDAGRVRRKIVYTRYVY